MTDLQAQLQAFAQAHGGTVRHGPQPRKPESYPQASRDGYPQALTCGSALAPSRAQAHAPAHDTGPREALRENPPRIGRTQPVQKSTPRDPWIEYSDDYTVWARGR